MDRYIEVLCISPDQITALNWDYGPSLPFPVLQGSLVNILPSALVLIGGKGQGLSEYLDTFLMLKPNENNELEWNVLNITLETPRHLHSAVLMPDNLVQC